MFTYFLADAARILGAFNELKLLNDSCKCLYQGKSEQNLAIVAPYIFTFPHSIEFSDLLLKKGWGDSWGVYVAAEDSIEEIRSHFRKFLIVKTEEGKEIYFRFYDPRVLRIFLPTCDVQQLREFFGPIKQFICEDEDAAFALLFSFDNNKLVTKRINEEALFYSVSKIDTEVLPGENESVHQQQKKPPRKFFID